MTEGKEVIEKTPPRNLIQLMYTQRPKKALWNSSAGMLHLLLLSAAYTSHSYSESIQRKSMFWEVLVQLSTAVFIIDNILQLLFVLRSSIAKTET